ncbi:MAG: hypothetical protein LBB67_05845 [Oscillospiraceae bacterium]|jgi:GH43 family beta-xylosidase|nr:hypothetical protein [Oscillospiraceae bacterium]
MQNTETVQTETPFMTYKGHPLVRCGDTIYYGSLADPYVIMIKISTTRDLGGLKVAEKVNVWLMDTDPDVSPLERIVQRCERHGLFNAIDIAAIWLERALKKAQ